MGTNYPSWRYHRTEPPRLVDSAEEDSALNADEWRRSPADFADAEAPPPLPPDAEPAPPPLPPPLPPSGADRRADIFGSTVAEMAERIAITDDIAVLELWRSYEDENPRGPRKGVIHAIANRVAELE